VGGDGKDSDHVGCGDITPLFPLEPAYKGDQKGAKKREILRDRCRDPGPLYFDWSMWKTGDLFFFTTVKTACCKVLHWYYKSSLISGQGSRSIADPDQEDQGRS
jgi:hypothetical protein